MKKLSRILSAVDFSKPALRAFDYALALSKEHGAELVVLQAVPLNQAFGWRARQRRALAARLRRRAEQLDVRFTERVQQGDPVDTILLHAGSLPADLIVVGTHQRRGFDRFRTGSVAERIAAKASVPVLSVPASARRDAVASFNHPVVAVDLNDGSDRIVQEGLRLARRGADHLTVAHVVPGSGAGVPPHSHRYGLAEYQGRLIQDARRRLPLVLPTDRAGAVTPDTRVLVGEVTSEITGLVDQVGGDVLIVGVPRRGPLSRAVFGATASRLLRVSRVPVLAVPDLAGTSTRLDAAPLRLAA